MFATLLGGLPRPETAAADATDAAGAGGASEAAGQVELAIRAQEAAGLEPITDGRLSDPGFERLAGAIRDAEGSAGIHRDEIDVVVGSWQLAAGLTERAVKQALPGPYTLGWQGESGGGESGSGESGGGESGSGGSGSGAGVADDRAARTMAAAAAVRELVVALAAAGCPMVEVEETEAHRIGDDEGERRLFREAHAVVTEGVEGTHLSLSIVGASADGAGAETILAAPYASLAVDLIGGPDNWNLVVRTPRDRGVIVGAMSAREREDEAKEVLLWGANYAASTAGRGIDRVGLGSASSYANLTWAAALRKMQALGAAARLATLPPGPELARSVDPRSINARAAALGRSVPRPRRR